MKNSQHNPPFFVLTSLSLSASAAAQAEPVTHPRGGNILKSSSIIKFDYCIPPASNTGGNANDASS